MTIRNCNFENTYSLASIKAIRSRGGYVKNVCIENCTHFNHSTEHHDCEWYRGAINIDSFYSHKEFNPDEKCPIDEGTPLVDGIVIKNITTETVTGNAIFICGLPEAPIKKLRLENVRAHGKCGMIKRNLENEEFVSVQVTSDADLAQNLQ